MHPLIMQKQHPSEMIPEKLKTQAPSEFYLVLVTRFSVSRVFAFDSALRANPRGDNPDAGGLRPRPSSRGAGACHLNTEPPFSTRQTDVCPSCQPLRKMGRTNNRIDLL